jgi:hypothetical protein
VVIAPLLLAPVARAQPQTTPIVDRNWDADLYVGAAHGSQRAVAMGGVAAALAEGAAGLLGNPGACALRPLASQDRWDWDAAISGFAPALGSDFDNNGRTSADNFGARVTTLAVLAYHDNWALGLGGTAVNYRLDPEASGDPSLDLEVSQARLVLARRFLDGALAAGVGLRIGSFALDQSDAPLFDVSGSSAEFGVVLSPALRDWRLGMRVSSALTGNDISAACDPSNCRGRILPSGAAAPWEVAVGGALRLAAGDWNGWAAGRFRDERALLLAADLVLVGRTPQASGIESFAAGELQASGRDVTLSPRVGAEFEWLPGRLRLRAGSYWEPQRFAGVPGRLHLTLGGELRLFAFQFWGAERRLALSMAVDGAEDYGNAGLSFGFWH